MRKLIIVFLVSFLSLFFFSYVVKARDLPVELEQMGQVMQLCGDVDSRGVADPPRQDNKFQNKRSCRMPDMIALSDTEWLVVYNEYATQFSTADWSRLVLQRTTDAGKTWTTQVINEHKKSDPDFLGNWNMSRFGVLPDGALVITSCVRYDSACYLFFSRDRGRTWSKPVRSGITDIAKSQLGRNIKYIESSNIVPLDDGTLVMMAFQHYYKHDTFLGNIGMQDMELRKNRIEITDVYHSKDNTKTWAYVSTIADPKHDLSESAILVESQKMQVYLRDDRQEPRDGKNPMVVFRSPDSGKTWEKVYVAQEARGQQTGAIRLKDGRVLAIYRNANPHNVGCQIWVHDPKTFRGDTFMVHKIPQSDHVFDIDGGATAELPNGKILLCYSSIRRDDGVYWRYPEKRVRLVVLPPIADWYPKK